MLQLLANDCYKVGAFLYAAKAFDTLERLDPNPEYWEGKRGACVGCFQAVCAGRERKEVLRDVLAILKSTRNPQVGRTPRRARVRTPLLLRAAATQQRARARSRAPRALRTRARLHDRRCCPAARWSTSCA